MLLESHLRLTMYVLCCFSLDILRLTGAAPTTEDPSQQSSALDAVCRFLRSSSTPPTATSASTASATNPMMLRSTRLRQRGCTLVASLITIHSHRSIRAILVQRKNIDPLVVTITLNFCIPSITHFPTVFCMLKREYSHPKRTLRKKDKVFGPQSNVFHQPIHFVRN